ncbi:hypothetical protein DL766_004994 [Monosporascus sp. MC13-8B]|uniref:Transcription factor domain-containing protein n=1 Tax=Monosporascus cannonballus TaxID=155416 RepID=A0ABY0H9Y5_9PEZI|nr:hypothetical protein DL762_004129 [Monosporascus cannonballus]RYO94348.1 hypothetical protein DL763_004064 [Monosporascus cannonballus]RYP30166.1 hypothetical protein DL766_004994 [Monosporascus sp. MC13-8B]
MVGVPGRITPKSHPQRTISLNLSPPPELRLIAFQWDIYGARMFDNFIWRSYGAGWLDRAAQGELDILSLDAVKAFSQFSFGQSNRIRDIQIQGGARYGSCLRLLRDKLEKGAATADGGQLLVPTILVLLMVASIQADRTAAVYHLGAIRDVLKMCGPEAFQQQSLRHAFEAARATLLIVSLFARRRLFLEEPRWQRVPWLLDQASKHPQSHLLDIFVTIPGLLEEERHMSEEDTIPLNDFVDSMPTPGSQHSRRLALCNSIAAQLEKLYRWRWDWQHENGQYVAADDESSWRPEDPAWDLLIGFGNNRWLTRLRFDRPVYANDVMLYNAALMWLMALLWKIEPSRAGVVITNCARRATPTPEFPAPSFFSPLLERPGTALSIRVPAAEVCRAYDWLSRHHHPCSATEDQMCLYLFPLGMARSVLGMDPNGREWITAMLDSSPVTRGYGTAYSSVAGFAAYITEDALRPDVKGAARVSEGIVLGGYAGSC